MEVKLLILHGLLHLAGYDHERDKGQMRRRETLLRKQFDLPAGLVERAPRQRRSLIMTLVSGLVIAILLVVLTLSSYIVRLYAELGKFLSGEFQENIDVWESRVEPRLGFSRERIALSAAVLSQCSLASLALYFGVLLFAANAGAPTHHRRRGAGAARVRCWSLSFSISFFPSSFSPARRGFGWCV